MLQTEVFEANEYIAACYTGVCDISGEVFLDSNGNGVYDRGIDSRKYYNEACGQQYSITGQDSVMPHSSWTGSEMRHLYGTLTITMSPQR